MTEETLPFQAEVSKLLDIVAHSLYSEKEIFLRELISNASDACDRLRYLAITKPDLIADDATFKITITVDPKRKTLTIADNGIGMDHDDLVEQLGTIARSGSTAFLESVTGDSKTDLSLIGQFGVGFTVEQAEREARGTTVQLKLAKGQNEFLETNRLKQIVQT